MKYSEIALKILYLLETEKLTCNQFWKKYASRDTINNAIAEDIDVITQKLSGILEENKLNNVDGFICPFDNEFPNISKGMRNSQKPILLFYRGNISLLKTIEYNVAVIGLINPDQTICNREITIVKNLVEKDLNIVSGLAKGCDTVAHEICLMYGRKTIAILPTQIGKIYPAENKTLAENIVKQNGLLITEYYKAPLNKYESIARFTKRDRLQAMFSKAVIMIASYTKGNGDSGSAYAMEAAEEFGIDRYVMYNEKTDSNNLMFGLNKQYLNEKGNVSVLTKNSIEKIGPYSPPIIIQTSNYEMQLAMDL